MNTHGIEIPPLPKFDRLSSMHADDVANLLSSYGRKCARAAIDADRKRTAELLKNPVHVHSNMCRGIIAPITFDMLAHVLGEEATNEWLRKRRGEPVPKGWKLVPETPTSKQIVHMACQIKGADADGWFRTDGDDWPEHVDAAERAYKWALSEAPQPAEPESVTKRWQDGDDSNMVSRVEAPADPVKLPSDDERAAQGLPPYNPRLPTDEEMKRLTENGRKAWGKDDTEPVKVPSDAEVLDIAIASGLAFRDSTGDVLCAWREDADISEYLVENARALLARYSHLTDPTHKSSNQNQLKG